MSDVFHALFGICRNKGGTKKACYTKAVKALGGKRRKSTKRRGTKRSSWCSKWGYSKKYGHPVCRKRKTRKRRAS